MRINAPIYSIVGTTASGKTKVALALARKMLELPSVKGVDLISADSKQVYRGLEILTGADLPANWQQKSEPELSYPFFGQNNLRLHGVSIISPDQEWSVGLFVKLAQAIIKQAEIHRRRIIVVGGTGLYHQLLLSDAAATQIPPDIKLREELANLNIEQLQKRALDASQERYQQLNASDRANPRRLIRLIEKAHSLVDLPTIDFSAASPNHDYFGLTIQLDELKQKIKQRINQRIDQGVKAEVAKIDQSNISQTAKSILGLAQVTQLLHPSSDTNQLLQTWLTQEFNYAKRQITWWKQKSFVKWFDPTNPATIQSIFEIVKSH